MVKKEATMKTKLYSIAALVILVTCAGCGNPFFPAAYKVGDRGPGDGIIFYDKGRFTDGWRYLEAAPVEWESYSYSYGYYYGYTSVLTWTISGFLIDIATGTGIGTGKKNTALILNEDPGWNAAQACIDYRGGGKSDWFLPSRDELNELYKQIDVVDYYPFGYSITFWSSSQYNADNAWVQAFTDGLGRADGSQGPSNKGVTSFYVRPIRSF